MKQQITIYSCVGLVVSAMAAFVYFSASTPFSIPVSESPSITSPAAKLPRISTSTTLPETARQDSVTHPSSQNNKPIVQEKIIDGAVLSSNGQTFPLRQYQAALIPNDPRANQSWVTSSGIDKAWDVPRGNANTVLAVIDTGFALAHEEFEGRWQQNSGEVGVASAEAASKFNCTDRAIALDESCNLVDDDFDGIVDNEFGVTTLQNPSKRNCTDLALPLNRSCNLIDDDGNGFIDDHTGWDFYNFDNSVQAGEIDPEGDGTQHGTYVTGVAAATGNNGMGIAGVDEGTKILPLQALADDGYGNTLSVARAIRYATTRGADVISLSLGSSAPDSYTRQAVREAVAAGIIVVAAAGNGGCECMVYPANYPEVLAVGALNSSNVPASFSAWGSNLDIMAPGTGLYTTDWRAARPTNAYAGGISGTSLATPIVSGMLTRMLSYQPNLSPLQAIAAITETTNRLSLSPTSPHSTTLGFGALNAEKSSVRVRQTHTPTTSYSYTAVSLGNALSIQSPSEHVIPSTLYECSAPAFGTTPVYEVTNSARSFFTASTAEAMAASEQGYSIKLTTYACMLLPHDQLSVPVRTINFMREFKNITDKP